MKQIISETLKQYIKYDIERNNYRNCRWKTEPINGEVYCHFLADCECGFWNPEPVNIELPQRNEFYRCNLPQMVIKL